MRGPIIGLLSVALSIAAASWIWNSSRSNVLITSDSDEGAELYRDQKAYVVDAHVGHRPHRSLTMEFEMIALKIGETPVKVVRRTNNRGFVRSDDLDGDIPRPRVLVLGDSHTQGIVGNDDNFTMLLERRLRESGRENATVLNAGCGFYSLYQYVLRAEQLIEQYEPDVVVVATFMGNDFIELEDVGRPHLDDDCMPTAMRLDPPPETTTQRKNELSLGDFDGLFWQGLNQAWYLHERPERAKLIDAKAAHCIELMDALTQNHNAKLLWVLIPPYQMVFPEQVRGIKPRAAEVIDSGAQQRLYATFKSHLDGRGSLHIDLLPTFQSDGRTLLYAADFHIFIEGHKLLAETVYETLLDLLPN